MCKQFCIDSPFMSQKVSVIAVELYDNSAKKMGESKSYTCISLPSPEKNLPKTLNLQRDVASCQCCVLLMDEWGLMINCFGVSFEMMEYMPRCSN